MGFAAGDPVPRESCPGTAPFMTMNQALKTRPLRGLWGTNTPLHFASCAPSIPPGGRGLRGVARAKSAAWGRADQDTRPGPSSHTLRRNRRRFRGRRRHRRTRTFGFPAVPPGRAHGRAFRRQRTAAGGRRSGVARHPHHHRHPAWSRVKPRHRPLRDRGARHRRHLGARGGAAGEAGGGKRGEKGGRDRVDRRAASPDPRGCADRARPGVGGRPLGADQREAGGHARSRPRRADEREPIRRRRGDRPAACRGRARPARAPRDHAVAERRPTRRRGRDAYPSQPGHRLGQRPSSKRAAPSRPGDRHLGAQANRRPARDTCRRPAGDRYCEQLGPGIAGAPRQLLHQPGVGPRPALERRGRAARPAPTEHVAQGGFEPRRLQRPRQEPLHRGGRRAGRAGVAVGRRRRDGRPCRE